MKALVYRTLYLNEAADARLTAMGCHWSFDECIEEVVERQMLSLPEQRTGGTLILFRTNVGYGQINWGATLQSNREHANECECVLAFEAEITLEYRDEQGEWVAFDTANVGDAGHAWVREADEATEAEIAALIADLQEWATIEA